MARINEGVSSATGTARLNSRALAANLKRRSVGKQGYVQNYALQERLFVQEERDELPHLFDQHYANRRLQVQVRRAASWSLANAQARKRAHVRSLYSIVEKNCFS